MFDTATQPSTLDAIAFDVEIGPMLDRNGNEISGDIARGMYRKDTDELIASCGKHTKPIQHMEVIEPALAVLKEQGHEIFERAPGRRDLEDLRGHRGAFLDVSTTANGAIMRCEIITGDFTSPTGSATWLPDGEETMLRRYGALNSHNSVYAAQNKLDYLRLKCMNGMVSVDFSAIIKGKHTSGFNLDAFKAKILGAAEMMEGDTARFEQYIKTPCSVEQAETFFRDTIAKQKNDAKGNPTFSEPLVKQLLDLFVAEPARNVWALYNALTAWATHGEMRSNSNLITARVGRDERVARAMRTNDFNTLLAA